MREKEGKEIRYLKKKRESKKWKCSEAHQKM